MTWIPEFTDGVVQLQYRKRVGDSRAESAFRVKVGNHIVWTGYGPGAFEEYQRQCAAISALLASENMS